MSCFVDIDGNDVWNPANQVARLFISQARATADAFRLDSGVGDVIEDQCGIDGRAFTSFVTTLIAEYEHTNNPTLRRLTEGVLVVSLALLKRAGLPPEPPDEWRECVNAQERHMPRP
ncbi:DUF6086 family protein [Streptomyces sp. NPDC048304]|uniref:DUF6086 family protein n=1 Tax=Streptomyces sp. NPDC048304 TaxID=3154820 RepID=UPI0034032F92